MAGTTDDWLGLGGRVCVVTGAGSGIGRASAAEFANVGAKVVLLDRDLASCQAAAEEISAAGGDAVAVECDVTDDASVRAAAEAAKSNFGDVDVLINNAGILRPGSLESVSIEDWGRLMDVNVTGYLRCAQAFGQDMLARGQGALVHVASIAASEPQAHSGAYSPGKAAVAMMSRQLAFEWGPRGVRSNVVSPGLVRTALSETFYQAPGVLEKREAIVPMRRVAKPEDIAQAAVFLASGKASYINGQEILIDGGLAQTLMSFVPRPGFE
ncbi:MAG: SDR family oxidoreductase [Hyphomicrobiales bacterium]|nr:SDR family oxidoreductase [Hyphomicrobiales bacterium]